MPQSVIEVIPVADIQSHGWQLGNEKALLELQVGTISQLSSLAFRMRKNTMNLLSMLHFQTVISLGP